MAGKTEIAGTICKEYLEKYPDLPLNQIAKMIYDKNKLLFNNKEAVRTRLRYYAGAQGVKARKNADPKYIRTKEESLMHQMNPFGLPESSSDKWEPYLLPIKKGNGLILADLHIPFHDIEAITLALQWGQKEKYTDFIILNGDIVDFYGLSRFQKDPTKRRFKDELDDINIFLDVLQREYPEAQIFFKEGNHEFRLSSYLMLKAPELFEMQKFLWTDYIKIKERGAILIKQDVPIKIGKLNLIHGHEMKGMSAVVNPARGAYLKAMECILLAHNHRTSQHAEMSFSRRLDTAWSIGCLCCLWPEYSRLNKWNHGFAGIRIDGKDFEIDNRRIFQGIVR